MPMTLTSVKPLARMIPKGIDNEDLEEAEAEDDSTKSHARHLDPENKRHLQNRTIYRKSLFITNPINLADGNLTPEQLGFKGMNLNRGEQAKRDLAIR